MGFTDDAVRRCAEPGCDKRRVTAGLCQMHYVRTRATGTHKSGGRGVHALTPEQEAEVVKLVRAFVTPHEIGRRFGIDAVTVRRIVRRAK